MRNNKIQITKKEAIKGEDGYKTFSIRIKEETVTALDKIANASNRSRNKLINLFFEYGVGNYEVLE
ncbi:MAG: CopG family transcriptional regulator [Oscillospiraceae bacterium]|jgi:hypothetical protein|nr:CopG family transcriptional regulator [Oscillospiraceae bacterium]